VGVGTTSPTSLLALGGTTARTIQMERNTTAATAGQGLTLSSGGAIAGTANLAGGDLNLKSGISTGTGTSALRFFTATAGLTGATDNAPTVKMVILGSGNVGIGDANPAEQFMVYKDNWRKFSLSYPTLYTTRLNMSVNGYIEQDSNGGLLTIAETYSSANSHIKFSLGGVERMRISQAGNLGIGTTGLPSANLHVVQKTAGYGTVATSGTTTLTGTGTQFTNTFKVGDTITVSGETVRTIATISSDTSLTVTVAFATSASSLSYALTGGDRFVVKGNGNVGIGTTSPTAVLHLKAGTATANTTPLKFTSGTSMTTPEAGAMEYDGTNLYFTPSTVRKTIAFTSDIPSLTGYVTYTGANANVDLGNHTLKAATSGFYNIALFGYNSTDGIGVKGGSENGIGVKGVSTFGTGVYGGVAEIGNGVQGYAQIGSGYGVVGNTAYFGDATNRTIFTDNGTLKMEGTATVFDDIQFKISSGKVSATNAPTWSAFGPYLSEYSFATDDFIDLAAEEFVHEWKEGSPVELHIHWATGSTDYIAGDRVQWKVCYSWCNMTTTAPHNSFTNFVNVYVEHVFSTTVTARSHIYSSFGSFTPTGGLIGAQIKVRLYRIAKTAGTNPSSNPYPLQIGMHYQKDTLGSRTTTGK